MAGTRVRAGTCAYCAQHAPLLEDEHVFPESWHPTTTPLDVEKITVPSCTPCNRAYGRVEERLQRQWIQCIDTSNPAAHGIWERVERSMDPKRGRNDRDRRVRSGTREKLRRSVRRVPVASDGLFPGMGARDAQWAQLPSGLVALSAKAIFVDGNNVASFTAKLVRGFHFYMHSAPLPTDVMVRTYAARQDTWPVLLAQVRTMTTRGTPRGFCSGAAKRRTIRSSRSGTS